MRNVFGISLVGEMVFCEYAYGQIIGVFLSNVKKKLGRGLDLERLYAVLVDLTDYEGRGFRLRGAYGKSLLDPFCG